MDKPKITLTKKKIEPKTSVVSVATVSSLSKSKVPTTSLSGLSKSKVPVTSAKTVKSSSSSSAASSSSHCSSSIVANLLSSNTVVDHCYKSYPPASQPQQITTLRGSVISLKENEYFNLDTSRRMKILDGRMYFLQPRVTGEAKVLYQYIKILHCPVVLSKSNATKLQQQLCQAHQECQPCILKLENSSSESESIDRVPQEDLRKLKPFTFEYIRVPAMVTRVIDGDTIECAFFLNPEELSLPVVISDNNTTTIGQMCMIGKYDNSDNSEKGKSDQLLIKLCIRVMGVDAADSGKKSDPPEKIKRLEGMKNSATNFTKNWCATNDNKIWLHLLGYDNRSRILGDVTSRGAGSDLSLTDSLLSYNDPLYGPVAVKYGGENKDVAWGLK